jgi:rod shape-determining protein MreC
MLKRPHYIAFGLVAVVMLIIMKLPPRTATQLKLSIGGMFLPLFGLASATQQTTAKVADAVTPRRELLRQNGELRHENTLLKLQEKQDRDIEQENDRLRKLISWQQRQKWKLKLARIVLRDPANWWRSVEIDAGTRDDIQPNMAVLAPDGALIGKVLSAGLTRSQVVMLGDPNCKAAARVENDAHDNGTIVASGPLDAGFVEMSYLPKNAVLKPGQLVKTSGDGGIFPADIIIGKIVDTRLAEYGLITVARVKLAANLNGLEEVWIRLK